MLGVGSRIPKVVSVRVKSAEGLKIIPKSEHKQKKLTQKWKVHFLGGKKKMSTSSVLDTYGNPQWDYEVTFKLASRSDPVVLLVTDSEDHHVGQVVVPLVAIPPRPQNPVERPTDIGRLQRVDLEPTKKVAVPHGLLHFWIWVEEYRSDESDSKSSRGSLLSLSGSKHNRASSVADSLNYSGSVISMNSSQGDKKEKKHHLFKKRHGKGLLTAAAAISTRRLSGAPTHDPSLSRSMGSVFDPTNRASLHASSHDYPHEDHDGSILGAGSDMTGSEFYAMGLMQRTGSQSRPVTVDRSPMRPSSQVEHSIPVATNRSVLRSPDPARRISPVREDPMEQERAQSMQAARQHTPATPQPGVRPELIRLSPNSCPTAGGVEVTVYCSGLTDDMMRYASVLVDGSTVPRQDWFLQEAGRSGQAELRIHMPERPTGRCWIELETMNHGRIRCPEEFQYTANESRNDSVSGPVSNSNFNPFGGSAVDSEETNGEGRSSAMQKSGFNQADSGVDSMRDNVSPFVRTASQRSSMRVIDRRSTRRRPPNLLPNTTTAPTTIQAKESQSPILSDESPVERYEASGEAGSESDHSPMDTFQNFSARRRNSHRSEASGQSRSMLDEHSKLETETLRSMLFEANQLIDDMKKQTLDLEKQLSEKSADVDRLSMELCKLRLRLLEGGATQYLEKCF